MTDDPADLLDFCEGFEWDENNIERNRERHRVTPEEAEDLFYNEPLVVGEDTLHSRLELRYYALGHTTQGRYLFVAFTIRGRLIRVISVRNMSRKERASYGKY